MQFSFRLVGLLACFLLLLSVSVFSSQTEIDGLAIPGWGQFYSTGTNVSAGMEGGTIISVSGSFNASNNPTIYVEEAFINTDAYEGFILTSGTVYVFVKINYRSGSGYTNEDWKLLGIIGSCSRGDTNHIALYCSYEGTQTGIHFTREQWNSISRIYFELRNVYAGIVAGQDANVGDGGSIQLGFEARAWLKCDVIPYEEPSVPEEVDLKDILKEEKKINNSINDGNSKLSSIDSKLGSLLKKDFDVDVDVDLSGVENSISDSTSTITGAIDGLDDSITGAIDGLGDSITGAIDGLADSIGDGINVDVGDVSVETDISWFQEGEGDTDLGEFDTDDVVSRSDYNSLFDPIGRSTGALYLADRSATFWNDLGNSSGGTLTLATLPENMGGASINLPTWNDIGNLTGGENSSGFYSSLPGFIGACIGLIVCLSLFVWIYNLLSK